jgi:chaperonin GroES
MITPLSDRIIVKVIEEKEAKGGLWTPEGARSTVAYGKVLAAGPGRTNAGGEITPMRLNKGDTVVFRPTASDFAVIDGEEVLTMYEGDVIGTV